MFPPIRYLEWIREARPAASVDLASSGLGETRGGIVPDRLTGLPDPPDGVTLESQIASRYDDSVSEEHVLVTAGTSHANVLVLAALVDGTETADPSPVGISPSNPPTVLVERPAYEPLVGTPRGLGARVKRVDRDPEQGYPLRPEDVGAAVDESTTLAVISNRHNPSGYLLERTALEAIAEQATKAGVPLLVDEVYAPYHSAPRDGPGTAFGGPTAAGIDGAIVTTSLTKFFGFGGLRIGWVIAAGDVIDRVRTVTAHLPDVAEPSRALARRVFHNLENTIERSRERIRTNATTLSAFVADREALDGPVHDGSTFAFPRHRNAPGDRIREVAAEAGIVVVPGRFFDEPDRFRLSVSGPPGEMREAVAAFDRALDGLG